MSGDEFKIIQIAVARICARLGLSQLAEDITQEVVCLIIERNLDKYYVRFLVIDVLRMKYRSQRKCHKTLKPKEIPVEQSFFEKHPELPIFNLDFDKIISNFKGHDRALLLLRYKWGLNLDELAEVYGVSESWISIQLKTIETEIYDTYPEFSF